MVKKFDPNHTKVQLKLAISRLKLQKTKKSNNLTNQKREIADLLRAGKDESARIKVEAVIREDHIIEAYEILELFCELILARLGVIQISKDCPPDIKEAVVTLIYAAPRADVKELTEIRSQLMSKYGKEFATDNFEAFVNIRVAHKLGVKTPENYLVYQYLNEIAKTHNVDWRGEEPDPLPGPMSPMSPMSPITPDPFTSNSGNPIPPFPDFQAGNSFPVPPNNADLNNFPSFNRDPIPSFPSPPTFQKEPANDFPPIPNFDHSAFPSFPSPPKSNPNEGTSNIPSFPSTPFPKDTSFGAMPEFPTPPSDNGSGLPDFPSPPASNDPKESSVPDFDELTARFERLKRKD